MHSKSVLGRKIESVSYEMTGRRWKTSLTPFLLLRKNVFDGVSGIEIKILGFAKCNWAIYREGYFWGWILIFELRIVG